MMGVTALDTCTAIWALKHRARHDGCQCSRYLYCHKYVRYIIGPGMTSVTALDACTAISMAVMA